MNPDIQYLKKQRKQRKGNNQRKKFRTKGHKSQDVKGLSIQCSEQ